jgi:prephenate dehydrogenase
VVLAVPMQAIADVAAVACREAATDAVIIHCCGVQSRGSLGLDEAAFARMFGAHPLAGSHKSGFDAARPELFADCTVSIESRAPEMVRSRMSWLWPLVGATHLEYRPAAEHDALMAWISHLPQLAATALAATLASGEIDPLVVGPGARDSTRLAASDFEQWSSLLGAQPTELDAALERLEGTIANIRTALRTGDQNALRPIWNMARAWRRGVEQQT